MRNELLLSMTDLKNMNILPKTFPDIMVNKIDSADQLRRMKEAIAGDYKAIMKDRLPSEPMAGEPMRIYTTSGAPPSRCLTPRAIPLHWKQAAKEAVEKLVHAKILV